MEGYQESFDMLMVLGECERNYRNAAVLYSQRYPERVPKSHMAFLRLQRRFLRFGSVKTQRRRERTVTNDDAAADVVAYITVNPHAGSRQVARESGITRRSVLRILHQHKFHPYHISLHQNLYGNDFNNRVNFCNWSRQKLAEK